VTDLGNIYGKLMDIKKGVYVIGVVWDIKEA